MSQKVLGSREIKSKEVEKSNNKKSKQQNSNEMKLYFGKNKSRQESQHCQKPDKRTPVFIGFGHHAVGKHGQDRPGRERFDDAESI